MIQPKLNTAHPGLSLYIPIREVEMEVVFGTPSKNCTGAGICMIASRLPQGQVILCPHAPSIVYYDQGREFVFRFRKQHLAESIVQRYFSSSKFIVEESFSLPQRLLRLWGLPPTEILPGQYALEEYSREWRVYFPLTSTNPINPRI